MKAYQLALGFGLCILMLSGAGLLIFWHIRHDVDGSLTYSRYMGKVVVGA